MWRIQHSHETLTLAHPRAEFVFSIRWKA